MTTVQLFKGDCLVEMQNLPDNIIVWSKKNINLAIENMRFDDAIKLIEWHFDIAGLIEKGEAIDINTLSENPYK